MCEKQNVRLFKLRYRINGNENEAENKKMDHEDKLQIDLGLDMDPNILDINCVSV